MSMDWTPARMTALERMAARAPARGPGRLQRIARAGPHPRPRPPPASAARA